PVILLGAVDYAAHWKQDKWTGPSAGGHWKFAPLVATAIAISIIYPGMGFLRSLQVGQPVPHTWLDMQAWLSAILAHALFCVFIVVLFNLAETAASYFAVSARWHFLLYNLLAWFLLDRIFQNVILATIPFRSLASQIYAAVFTLAIVMLCGSL